MAMGQLLDRANQCFASLATNTPPGVLSVISSSGHLGLIGFSMEQLGLNLVMTLHSTNYPQTGIPPWGV